VVEEELLGTAGAVALAAEHIGRAPIMVMNGDTYLEADLGAFLEVASAHQESLGALMAVCVRDVADFGSLNLQEDGCIASFVEKGASGEGLVSAGVYYFKPSLVQKIRRLKTGSLEKDIFQNLDPGSILCHPVAGSFLDIGTPERLADFQDMMS
jgi:NDP-sugar pyrophosphorylase family protein